MPSRHQKRFNHAGQHVVTCDSETLSCPVEGGPGHQTFMNSEQIISCFAGLRFLLILSPWALRD